MKKNLLWLTANGLGSVLLLAMMAAAIFTNFNPEMMEELVETTGNLTIWWLLFTLAITPLITVFGWRKLHTVRKSAGLYAFAFGLLHLIFYAGEHSFGLGATWTAVIQEARLWTGLLAVAIMLPLALTSNRFSMKQMGKKWKLLHRLTYIVAVLAVVHVALFGEGLIYLPIVALLLALRIPRVRKRIASSRLRRKARRRKSVVVSG